MRLVFTTDDFIYGGRARPGFPLILADDMRPAQPFHDYLHHILLGAGRKLDDKTWDAYGRRLWDFCRFLNANGLVWDQPFVAPGEGVVAQYRDWSVGDIGLSPGTFNDRIRLIVRFYEWAQEKGLIGDLPFGYEDAHVTGIDHDLKHVDGGNRVIRRPDMLEDEWADEPAFLTAEQIKESRSFCRSLSRELLFDLMVRVGLRSCEARTFPLKYVFDPLKRKSCLPGTMIAVRLDPKDMEIKFKKPRVVHVPYSLMQRLYQYTLFERNLRTNETDRDHRELILTVHGRPYSKDAVGSFCRSLGEKVGYRVAALMLRHSYAIHTLIRLRNKKDYEGEPLLYVRDRLGHEDANGRLGRMSLIFLRWQLKHSSVGWTQLYASNPRQDESLYQEMWEEFVAAQAQVMESWFDLDSVLSGGAGKRIMQTRAVPVKDKRVLLRHTAETVTLRNTGHSWCLAEQRGCVGEGIYEASRCTDCSSGVIDQTHVGTWQRIHLINMKLADVADCGPGAIQRAKRDIARSERTLEELGVPLPATADLIEEVA